jgi:hypothetical protein
MINRTGTYFHDKTFKLEKITFLISHMASQKELFSGRIMAWYSITYPIGY